MRKRMPERLLLTISLAAVLLTSGCTGPERIFDDPVPVEDTVNQAGMESYADASGKYRSVSMP